MLDLRTALLRERPDDYDNLSGLAHAYTNLSLMCQANPERQADAQTFYEKAEETYARILQLEPHDYKGLESVATLRVNRAYTPYFQGRTDEAIDLLTRNVAPLEKALTQEPTHVGLRLSLFATCGLRGEILGGVQRFRDALADWERCVTVADDGQRTFARLSRVKTYARVGDHHKALAEVEALAALLPADAHWNQTFHLGATCAVAIEAVEDDAQLSTVEKAEKAEKCATRAVAFLKAVRARVSPAEWGQLVAETKTAADWKALLDWPEYTQLLEMPDP
jgi:tetratricopeptide (TPR) repeat protein